MIRTAAGLLLLASSIQAQTVAHHEYDPVSDAVVSWRLDPGSSAGQSFRLESSGTIHGFRVELMRANQPAVLEYRLGKAPGGSEFASGRFATADVSPWFEHWKLVQLAKPVHVEGNALVYLQIRVPQGSAGAFDLFGTAQAKLKRAEFRSRFQYVENWYAKAESGGEFENPANIDYGAKTPMYPRGSAFDGSGREIPELDFAFEVFGPAIPEPECNERFSFISSITGPLYTRSLIRRAYRPAANEVGIDSSWRVQTKDTSPVLQTAVQEFRQFLSIAMAIPAKPGATRTISAQAGCGSPPEGVESFSIQVNKDGISVCGRTDRGAMHGLHHLESLMRMRSAPILSAGEVRRGFPYSPRMTSAPFYSRTELETPIDSYTDGLLGRMSRAGFNAIWVWGDLDDVGHSAIYPELDHGVAQRQARLRDLVARAGKYGIDVYVQLANKPLPESFYQRHPDTRGSELPAYGGVNILCTSVEGVRRHVRSATANLMKEVPGLQGIMFIVGGEGFMHCWMRKNTCPRCIRRAPQETIAEFSRVLFEAVRSVKPEAAVALWPYSASNSWSKDDTTQSKLIERLPAGMTLLTEFAKEGDITFGGITIPAYDYPITIAGPSARFRTQADLAHRQGLNLWTKTEHAIALEFIQTPYIPAHFQYAERFRRIRKMPAVSGVFANWMHYGFTPSRAADVFYWSLWETPGGVDGMLSTIAKRDFGPAADAVTSAWRSFSEAIREYPFSGPMAMGVVQKGPAHPLFFDPAYKPAHGTGRQFKNDLTWTKPWGPDLTIAQFTKVERLWAQGVAQLDSAVDQSADKAALQAEIGVARALLACIRSTLHIAKFYRLRDELHSGIDRKRQKQALDAMARIAEDEIRNAREALPFVCSDSRIGYANSGKNDQTGVPRAGIYSPGSIRKKIAQVERVLNIDIPEYRKANRLD